MKPPPPRLPAEGHVYRERQPDCYRCVNRLPPRFSDVRAHSRRKLAVDATIFHGLAEPVHAMRARRHWNKRVARRHAAMQILVFS